MTRQQPYRRRWHPLAIASATVVAVTLVLANLPGSLAVSPDILGSGKYGPHFLCYPHLIHGWPLTFLSHYGEGAWVTNNSFEYSAWRIGDVIGFQPLCLLLDVGVAMAITIAAGSLVNIRLKTRGLQFSLLEFLIVVVVASLSIGYFVDRWRLHQAQVAALHESGTMDPSVAEWQPFGPFWLRSLTGDWFWSWGDHLVAMYLHHSDQLESLPGKRLIKVVRLSNLRCRPAPALEQLPNLLALDLMMVGYACDEEEYGAEPEEWRWLRSVGRCRSLEGLNLYDAGVTNRGLAELAGLKKLENLELSANFDINDHGLAHLKSLTNLRVLGLQGTSVTAAGIKDLQNALPHCEISWDGMVMESL